MNDNPAESEEEAALRTSLAAARQEHADLDDAISALEAAAGSDQLRIARMKKRKLMLRDQIVLLEDQLTPDIIA